MKVKLNKQYLCLRVVYFCYFYRTWGFIPFYSKIALESLPFGLQGVPACGSSCSPALYCNLIL